jgi:DNA-binding response OmpR family regulator
MFLAEHPGQVVSIEDIFTNVWGYDTDVNVNNVKWYVWRLRQKLEGSDGAARFIFTERGAGYRFTSV